MKISNKDDVKINEKMIEELRYSYTIVSEVYTSVRTKILTFIGSIFALLSYLYSSNNSTGSSFDNMFLPSQAYGAILYFIGLICIFVATVLLLLGTAPVPWELPIEKKEYKERAFDTYISFLIYTKDRYLLTLETNIVHCERKQKYLNLSFPLLIIGAIILLIIKNFS